MKDKFQPEDIITEIIKKLHDESNASRNNAPDLTRDIYEIDVTEIKDIIKLDEFDLVCKAVDKLIEDGKVIFDASNGDILLTETITPADPDTTSPGPHVFD